MANFDEEIDEAIAHAREIAEEERKEDKNCKYKAEYGCKGCAYYYSKPCIKCAEEHEQLAEWLGELKAYREIGTVQQCKNSVLDVTKTYNKAIDDFEDKLLYQIGDLGKRDIIQETAEQLKAGWDNE